MIATWILYANLHMDLIDYTWAQAVAAHERARSLRINLRSFGAEGGPAGRVGVSLKEGRELWSYPFELPYDETIVTPMVWKDLVIFAGRNEGGTRALRSTILKLF